MRYEYLLHQAKTKISAKNFEFLLHTCMQRKMLMINFILAFIALPKVSVQPHTWWKLPNRNIIIFFCFVSFFFFLLLSSLACIEILCVCSSMHTFYLQITYQMWNMTLNKLQTCFRSFIHICLLKFHVYVQVESLKRISYIKTCS